MEKKVYEHIDSKGKHIALADLNTVHLENIIKKIKEQAFNGIPFIEMLEDTIIYGEQALQELHYYEYAEELERREAAAKSPIEVPDINNLTMEDVLHVRDTFDTLAADVKVAELEFRDLDSKENKEFRTWANENYKVGDPIPSFWHPIVRAECESMNQFMKDNFGFKQGELVPDPREEIIKLVVEMRNAQKQYFATRSGTVLNFSKALEKQVDDAIYKYFNPDTQKLF